MSSSFQEIILKLQDFWASHGCLITQPYYTQVGAGTMNPATFLRALGPEPWNVAYVEPSVRPDDGRYGENPNRLHMFYQYQVILKPDPGNPQELYLESLKALGIDPRQHDIRFVEDNWEQPAISAWGLGWEVWLDGQEITQFTYFQQMGGVALDPVSVEITYGLERILIALNNAKDIWHEEWGAGVTYGEIRHADEVEHSKYYFEVADVERVRAMYDLFSAEADACLAHAPALIVPAHDYVLKCSHCFNILDTRGAISVAERQAFFRRIRELARGVAVAYGEQRKGLEYPLLKKDEGGRMKDELKTFKPSTFIPHPSSFILEIGVEELPAGDVDTAQTQLRERIPTLLKELYLEHGDIRIFTTPRRIVVSVDSLSPNQPDREDLVKGPPADKAIVGQTSSLSSTGGGGQTGSLSYTPAAQGFAKKNGIKVEDLEVREQDGGKYVFAVVSKKGRPAPEVLAEALPKLIESIKFEKSMRWNESGVAFSRPIRWYVALLGDMVIPFEYAGVVSGNVSRGLRPYSSPDIKIPSADKYFDIIRESGIVLDKEERKASIVEQVNQAAALVGGQAIIEEGLLNEVTNLIEMPTAVMGGFNEEFLSLPRDVLISVMKKHQRYFPVVRATLVVAPDVNAQIQGQGQGQGQDQGQGQALPLRPHFIAIRNGDDIGIDTVREGNEHVLGARFADANFFVREDVKNPLDYYRAQLSGLTFHAKLGSMLDKSTRIENLVNELIPSLGLEKDEAIFARRAAHLMKADLATQMVTEMTSLQGIIGGEYALRSGEQKDVAAAISEQYQTVPQTKVGLAIALADRLDSLVGLFAAGLAPTGAKDPFGLRRAAIGVVQPLIEHGLDFDLTLAVQKSAKTQPLEVSADVQKQILEFIAGRLKVVLGDMGFKHDVIEAVLAAQSNNPAGTVHAVKQLSAWVSREDWSTILDGFARCVRILRSQTTDRGPWTIDESIFVDKEEKDLYQAIQKTVNVTAQGQSKGQSPTIDEFLEVVTKLIPAITAFFDKVLVMAEDKAVKENRLGLLQKIANLANGIADLSKLEGF